MGERRCTLCTFESAAERALQAGIRVAGAPQGAIGHIDISRHDGQQIVEVVSDASGQLTDRFHLLRLSQSFFGLRAFFHFFGHPALELVVELLERLFSPATLGEVEHRSDHPDRLAFIITDYETTVIDVDRVSVDIQETIFIGPVAFLPIDHRVNALVDTRPVVRMDVFDPPVAGGIDIILAITEKRFDRLVPLDLIGRQVPIPNCVIGGFHRETVAFLRYLLLRLGCLLFAYIASFDDRAHGFASVIEHRTGSKGNGVEGPVGSDEKLLAAHLRARRERTVDGAFLDRIVRAVRLFVTDHVVQRAAAHLVQTIASQ